MRGRLGLVAVIGVALTVPLTAGAGTARATSRATVVVAESPVDAQGDLQPGFHVTHRYGEASCNSGSELTGTAYRCFTAQSRQGVYDPCWVTAHDDVVVCQDRPWTRSLVQLRVTRGYGDSAGFSHVGQPWGLGLASGPRCLRVVGATGTMHGHPITYTCNKHTILTNRPDRGASRWRVRAYRLVGHGRHRHWRSLGRQPITTAWRGAPSRNATG